MSNSLLKQIIEEAKPLGINLAGSLPERDLPVRAEFIKSLVKKFKENFNEQELVKCYKETLFDNTNHSAIPLVLHAISIAHKIAWSNSDRSIEEKSLYNFNAIIAESIQKSPPVSNKEATLQADAAFYNTIDFNHQATEMFIKSVISANEGNLTLHSAHKKAPELYRSLEGYRQHVEKKSSFSAPQVKNVSEMLSRSGKETMPSQSPKVSL